MVGWLKVHNHSFMSSSKIISNCVLIIKVLILLKKINVSFIHSFMVLSQLKAGILGVILYNKQLVLTSLVCKNNLVGMKYFVFGMLSGDVIFPAAMKLMYTVHSRKKGNSRSSKKDGTERKVKCIQI